MSDFRTFCDDLLRRARDGGWDVVTEKPLPYGRQYGLLRHGATKAVLSCYHGKKGFKHVPGGQAGAELAETLGGAAPRRGGAAAGGDDPFGAGTPRIGGDESGKGDYFGPLVVAAWRIEEGEAEELRRLRVTDSKALKDGSIERIAGQLEERGAGMVRVLMPREYNPRYAQVGNLNVLLSEMHGQCVRALLEAGDDVPPRAVVIDQFAQRVALLERTARLPDGCKLITRPKGEADPAVAAASILARAAFVSGLRDLSHEFGFTFPPGAGTPVLVAGREFVRTFGRERLPEVAKVHFATSEKLG